MYYKTILVVFYLSALIGCDQKERLTEIRQFDDHGELSAILNNNSIIFNRTYSFTEDDIVDSVHINLSKGDWDLLTKAYFYYSINKFNDSTVIGEKTNSIEFPQKYILKTSRDTTYITYNYFLNENQNINQDRTNDFKNFLKVFDSIVSIKQKIR